MGVEDLKVAGYFASNPPVFAKFQACNAVLAKCNAVAIPVTADI